MRKYLVIGMITASLALLFKWGIPRKATHQDIDKIRTTGALCSHTVGVRRSRSLGCSCSLMASIASIAPLRPARP